ncbi:MAG: cupin domain-containing protein [Candidatus Thermoplasmatota archaeon]|nr:cupin domain-containing protein [Candidatus Thermoplasmatota archaeon]
MKEDELALTGEQLDLGKFVTDEGGIWSLRDVEKIRGWNNIEYGAGLSGKNTPSTGLSMNRAYIPPGGIAKAHIHVDFDVMIFLLKGSVRHEYGPGCRKSVIHSAGDMFYIEPGLPHEVFNCSEDEWVHAIVARSDSSEWQNIEPYDRDSE